MSYVDIKYKYASSTGAHASWGTDVKRSEVPKWRIRMDGQAQRIQLVSADGGMALGHRIQVMWQPVATRAWNDVLLEQDEMHMDHLHMFMAHVDSRSATSRQHDQQLLGGMT